MPYVIVKLLSGRSEQQKTGIAAAVTRAVIASTGNGEDAVSIAIEDVEPSEQTEKVYKPDILGNSAKLYKRPGYDPL